VPVVFMANNIGVSVVKQVSAHYRVPSLVILIHLQILLLSFESAEHQWIAYRTVSMASVSTPPQIPQI
jgi:hypothetical protein